MVGGGGPFGNETVPGPVYKEMYVFLNFITLKGASRGLGMVIEF